MRSVSKVLPRRQIDGQKGATARPATPSNVGLTSPPFRVAADPDPCMRRTTPRGYFDYALYRRLTDREKQHTVALAACARKLLIFANTVVARGTPWTEPPPAT